MRILKSISILPWRETTDRTVLLVEPVCFLFLKGKIKVDPSFLNKISFDLYISYMRLIYRSNFTNI